MIDEMSTGSPRSASPRTTTPATENGWLIELYKDGAQDHRLPDGRDARARSRATICTACAPLATSACAGACGSSSTRCASADGETRWQREEHMLDASTPQRLFIPKDVATGLENIGDEEGWLINYPDPAYDPDLKDEQVEYTQAELEAGVVK